MEKIKGFTLTEIIITMILIIILSLISLPIYRGRYSNYSKLAEGYALLGAIRDAQINYYNEYGYFLNSTAWGHISTSAWTSYDPVLNINATNNRYFSWFNAYDSIYSRGNSKDGLGSLILEVRSTKAGTIQQVFNLYERRVPNVINGSTDLSI